jgi:hypothetical protein
VGTVVIQLHGELRPVTGQLNVTTELMSRNVKIFISDTLLRNEALEAPLEQIKQIAREALTVPFAQDWRQRAVDSGYLVRGNVKLETPSQSPLRPSTQSFKAPPTPARSSVPPNTPTPTVSSHLVAGSGFGFNILPSLCLLPCQSHPSLQVPTLLGVLQVLALLEPCRNFQTMSWIL